MATPGRGGIDSDPLPEMKGPLFEERRRPAPREAQPGETPPEATSQTVSQLESDGWVECGKCKDYVKSVSAEGICPRCEETVANNLETEDEALARLNTKSEPKTIMEAFLKGDGAETPVLPSWPAVDLGAITGPLRKARAILGVSGTPTIDDVKFLWQFLRDMTKSQGLLDRLVAIAADSRDAMGFAQLHNLATAVRMRKAADGN